MGQPTSSWLYGSLKRPFSLVGTSRWDLHSRFQHPGDSPHGPSHSQDRPWCRPRPQLHSPHTSHRCHCHDRPSHQQSCPRCLYHQWCLVRHCTLRPEGPTLPLGCQTVSSSHSHYRQQLSRTGHHLPGRCSLQYWSRRIHKCLLLGWQLS